ncbi:MAG: protein kinase, partial [Planctomycetota bacterium]
MSTDHDAPAPGPQGPDDPTVPRSRGTGHHPRKSGRTPQRPALQGTEPITPDAADGHETLDVTRPRPATRRTGNDPAAPDTPVRASGRVRPTGRTSSDALPGNPTSDRRRARGKTGMSARTVHPAQTTLTHRPVRVAAAATPVSAVGFARYRMGSELGRGGLGLVQEAEDLLLRRDLAIKTLLRPDPASTAAFIEEAQITGQLEHPNIVPVHELGFDPQGRPYLAMKRVQGHTLRNEIARRHDSGQASEAEHHAGERRLLEVFIKVCDAVGYAHSRGVIHRDLKPDNVMVGEFGEVLVMDWGLARPTAAADDDSHAGDVKPATRRRVVSDRREAVADVTMEGDVFGTPAYMAPEQAAGHASEIGPAADIYALGAILYTILTGVAPFSGHAMVILDDVRNGKLVPPSQRGPAVPRELEAVTLRAMALDPADRYASAAELRDDIQRYMSGRALTAADYTSWQLLWKWARRHKVAVAGALSTAAAIIIGLAGIIVSRDQAREAELDKRRQEATQYAQTAHDTLATAQRVRFNRASPQDYYRAWLPLMLQLGQAIQTHPEPPQAWRDELAGYCRDVQQNATSIADWGMATHVAQSAGAWRALDSAATTQAVHEVELAREARIAEDVGRLRKVLDHIRELETGRPPDNGYHWHDPRRYAPSEFEERSMRLVARARQDPAPLTATVLGLLSADNASLDRVGLSAPPTWLQQAFLLDLLGRLRDPWTAFNGQTATDMATARLKQPYDPATNQETAGWAMAAAYLDCAADRPVSTQLGEPLVDVIRRRNDAHPSMAMAIAYFGINTLAAAQNDNMSEIKLSDASVTFTCDWLVSSARSGSDFTAALLDELDPPPGKPALSTGQEHIVIDLLGRWGDSQPPDVDRPERSAPALLGRVLHAIPEQQVIRDQPPGGRTLQARAVIVTNSLARLDAREYGAEVFSLMDKAGARSIYLRDCRQSARLFDFVPWDCDTPSRARTLALAEKMRG